MKRPHFLFFLLFLALLPAVVFAQTFTRNLYFGMRSDSDVVKMQNLLRGLGYFTYPVSTGNYFSATVEAVKKFQKANGVEPLGGYFGPKSRAAANKIITETNFNLEAQQKGAPSASAPSPYKNKIVINFVTGSSDNPQYENITLENKTEKERINITGFVIENSLGERFVIPQGHELPGIYPAAQDQIILRPRDQALITAGRQDKKMDFRENICTGYFAESGDFIPSLSQQCPQPDTSRLTYLSDSCNRAIQFTSACRTVNFSQIFDSACSDYVNAHFNYTGCVRDYRNREDFYSNRWLIWMQRTDEFLKNVREKITLKDQAGRFVDEYNY